MATVSGVTNEPDAAATHDHRTGGTPADGAKGHVLSHPMLTYLEADKVLGRPGWAFQLSALEGTLIAINNDGVMLVPEFQLERGRVRPIVSEINALLQAGNPWCAASWWFGTLPTVLPAATTPADAVQTGGYEGLLLRAAKTAAAAREPTQLPGLGITLDEARSKITAHHFAKEALTDAERELLRIAEGLLRLIDERVAGGGTAH